MTFLPLIFALLAFATLYFYFKDLFQYWKKRNVQYEEPTFLFGNFLEILFGSRTFGKYLEKLYKKFDAPYFGIFILNNPILVVKDPKIIKNIFIKEFDSFGSKMLFSDDKFDPIFCNSLMGMGYEKWKYVRPKVTSIFSSGKTKMMMHFIKRCGEDLETYLQEVKGQKIQIDKIVENFFISAVSSCIFGIECNCFRNHNAEYKRYGLKLLPRSGLGAIKFYSYHFIHPLVKLLKLPFLSSESAKYFRKVFAETIHHRRTSGHRRNDLIDILLDLEKNQPKDDNVKFDDKLMLGQAIGFFVAGYDTTALILSMTLHEITRNPEIQNRLKKEISEIIEKHGELTYESLQNMTYASMVVFETLRKYPVLNFLQRKCVKEYVIPETNLKIDVGTNILVPTYGLHYDEKYFPNPEKFDPERFACGNQNELNQCVYLPFSSGPRSCVGRRFALMSIKTALFYILKNFKLEKNSDTKEKLTFKTSHIGHASDNVYITCVPA